MSILETIIYKENPIRTGWVKGGTQITKKPKSNWRDYIDLYEFKTNKLLSLADGDDLLLLIRRICRRQGIDIVLPKRMRTIHEAVCATLAGILGI